MHHFLSSFLYTRAHGQIPEWGARYAPSVHPFGRKRLYTARSFMRWVGRSVVTACKLTALLRCPERLARQVKLTKPLILGYPDKIGCLIRSLRCYASRRRDAVRTIPEID